MKATVNGETRELPGELTVAELLEQIGSPGVGVAVARNGRVVRRAEYRTHRLAEGDCVEIVKAVAGG